MRHAMAGQAYYIVDEIFRRRGHAAFAGAGEYRQTCSSGQSPIAGIARRCARDEVKYCRLTSDELILHNTIASNAQSPARIAGKG